MKYNKHLICTFVLVVLAMESVTAAEESVRRIASQNPYSKAVVVTGKDLIQSAQFYPTEDGRAITADSADAQVRQLFENLSDLLFEAGAQQKDLVKLNFYVASPEVRRLAIEQLRVWRSGKD